MFAGTHAYQGGGDNLTKAKKLEIFVIPSVKPSTLAKIMMLYQVRVSGGSNYDYE